MTALFLSVLEISVSVSLIIGVIWLLSPLLNKRYASKWKYLIWIFLAVRLLLPVSGAEGRSAADLLMQWKESLTPEAEQETGDTLAAVPAPRRVVVEIPAQMTEPVKTQGEKSVTPLGIAAAVWILGSFVYILMHTASYLHYKRKIVRNAEVVRDVFVMQMFFRLKRELHIRRAVPILEYSGAASPMIIGFLRPVLVLPGEWYSEEELFFILKHELVHLKRGDVGVKMLFMLAGGVHWFNPLIWFMQKEAAVDMELSCDERVTKGSDFSMRKAYTETLLATLHKGYVKNVALSTGFYGGKKVMKKRFKNILRKKGKKNGISVLACAMVLTLCVGTLVGCSVREGDTEEAPEMLIDVETANGEASEEIAETTEPTEGSGFAAAPEKIMLTFMKEGEAEEKQASLVRGDGYSFYLPDGEWQQSDADIWEAVANANVRIWTAHYEGESIEQKKQDLAGNGFMAEEGEMVKPDGTDVVKVRLYEAESDVWGVFYCYPVEAEEGWGRSLPVIADTFAVSAGDNGQAGGGAALKESTALAAAARPEIERIVDEFVAAYFGGDAAAVQKFLTSSYQYEVSVYQGAGTVSSLTKKGLYNIKAQDVGNGPEIVSLETSLEFRGGDAEDTLQYLAFTFVKENGDWKISFYGVEG